MENQGRFISFLILSTVILVVYSYLNPPSPPSRPAVAPNAAVEPASVVAKQAAPAVGNFPPASPVLPAPRAVPSNVPSRSVTVETGDYTAILSNRGAVLTGFALKRFQDRTTRKPIQLVHPDPTQPKPFALTSDALPGLSEWTFAVEGDSRVLEKDGDTYRVVFRGADKNGASVEKTFTFTAGSYVIGFGVAVRNSGRREMSSGPLTLEWPSTLGVEEFTGTQSSASGIRVITHASAKLNTEKPKKGGESVEIPPPIAWTALADQFFLAALIPDPASGPVSVKVTRDRHAYLPLKSADAVPEQDPKLFAPRPRLVFQAPALATGEGYRRQGRVFFGPQEYDLLKDQGIELERVVNFGMFGFISVYMLKLLKIFFGWFHNWGIAILLLSILVKIVLWWPTHSSYIHMSETQRKMKEVQPQLDAMKKKYANDRQKLNQEMGLLYQKAGINPMGGCLPMFLQIPVFFALYSTLVNTIELRGAPFFFWIRDLSLRDSWYVLPLLMGVSMIVQQRVSGQMSAGAPAGQQKFMMWFFPVFLTAISLQWPSGLLLYWVVTNLLSIVQQKMVNRQLKKART